MFEIVRVEREPQRVFWTIYNIPLQTENKMKRRKWAGAVAGATWNNNKNRATWVSECQSGHFGPCFHPERIDPNFVRPISGPYIQERRRLRHQRPRYDVSRLGVLGELVEFIYEKMQKGNGCLFLQRETRLWIDNAFYFPWCLLCCEVVYNRRRTHNGV